MSDDTFTDPLETTRDPLIGTVIQERYRVEKKLGQGGMGAVYLAEHILIQKKVAIKCLHAGLASNADVVRRFHNEAVAATAIGHPNIVDVTDMGRFDDGTFFMALEFLPGQDWQDDLDASGAQPLEKVAHIGVQICDALEAAAAKGIVHRDLKPENIFLIERHGDPYFVKVLDFGISKFHDGIGGSTKTGELMGTPYYMAPEQVRGEKDINHLADIYALGVIFFQALTGSVPFDGNTLPELILKIAVEEAPRINERIANIPEEMQELVAQMLAKNAADRPQTFHEVGATLAQFLAVGSRVSRETFSKREAMMATAIGGTADEPSKGEAVPERGRQATPVASRGPDTSAGGTPGLFGKTELPEADAPQAHQSTTITNASTESVASPVAPRSSSSKAVPFALAALALIGGGYWASQQRAPAEQAIAQPSNDKMARVQISTMPPDAELYLDGEPISNPFDGELEKDRESHRLVAKREGFEDLARKIVLTSSQTFYLPLKAIQAPLISAPSKEEKSVVRPLARQYRRSPPATAPKAQPAPAPAAAPAPVAAPPVPMPVPAAQELKKIKF